MSQSRHTTCARSLQEKGCTDPTESWSAVWMATNTAYQAPLTVALSNKRMRNTYTEPRTQKRKNRNAAGASGDADEEACLGHGQCQHKNLKTLH
jgi:hypothetical protein